MNKRKQKTTTEIFENYTLSRVGEPYGEFKHLYIATVRGVKYAVGYFAAVDEAAAAADANLTDYVTQLETKRAYCVENLGTVSVDTGTIVILDPCHIGRIAATQDPYNLVGSPLYPERSIELGRYGDKERLVRQIIDPPVPGKENPKEIKDFGTTGGNALSIRTGLGDGEYSVIAESLTSAHFGVNVSPRSTFSSWQTRTLRMQKSSRKPGQRSNSTLGLMVIFSTMTPIRQRRTGSFMDHRNDKEKRYVY